MKKVYVVFSDNGPFEQGELHAICTSKKAAQLAIYQLTKKSISDKLFKVEEWELNVAGQCFVELCEDEYNERYSEWISKIKKIKLDEE